MRRTGSLFLQHRKDMIGRVFEPRYRFRTRTSPEDSFAVGLHAGQIILLHANPILFEIAYGALNVFNYKIENGVFGRMIVVRLIDEDPAAPGEEQFEAFGYFSHLESQRLAVELLRLGHIVDGEAAEGGGVSEHGCHCSRRHRHPDDRRGPAWDVEAGFRLTPE